jgi:hypothetical protein
MEPHFIPGQERPPQAGAPTRPVRPVHSVLEFLEDLLIRMIKGIVRFIFVRVPFRIIELLNRYFPTLVKFIKVLFLLLVWLGIGIGPVLAVLFWYDPGSFSASPPRVPYGRPATLDFAHSPISAVGNLISAFIAGLQRELAANWLLAGGAVLWGGLFVAGSVWGLFFAVRRRRRERGSRRRDRRGANAVPPVAG